MKFDMLKSFRAVMLGSTLWGSWAAAQSPVVPLQSPQVLPVPTLPGTRIVTAPATTRAVVEPALVLAPTQSPLVSTSPVTTEEAAAPVVPQNETEKIVADFLKKKDAEKKAEEEKKKKEAENKKSQDLYGGTQYDLFSLYDNLSRPSLGESKKWYDKISLRGYTQFRFDRTLATEDTKTNANPNLFGDRFLNGNAENFGLRRMRLTLSGDISDYLSLYMQTDFGGTFPGSTQTYAAQLRDIYGDVYLDTDKVNRLRVGLSKIPYGFDNLQSSQNRVTLDRSDAFNNADPNERDLGLFYYYTPVDKQKLFKTLVDSGLKGSGNFGIFAFGVYNGQSLPNLETNLDLHMVTRLSYPWQLDNGQVFETGVQAQMGRFTVATAAIRPNGAGAVFTPTIIGNANEGYVDERVAATFVWYPQPFGIQAEWEVGRGPALSADQRRIEGSHLDGGYITALYRHQTNCNGIFTPYSRYQMYNGGYKSIANTPFAHQRELDIGIEWQIRKDMELTVEYGRFNVPNFTAQGTATSPKSYNDFSGSGLRVQFQINY